jgi:hypothetical protein
MWPSSKCAAKPRQIASPNKPGSQNPFSSLAFYENETPLPFRFFLFIPE